MAKTIKLKPEEYSEARIEIMKENGTWVEPKKQKEVLEIKKEVTHKISKKKEIQITIKDSLVKDIVKLYKKYYDRARMETIMYYWELGKRLNKEYGKPNPHGGNRKNQDYARDFEKTSDELVKQLKSEGLTVCKSNLVRARKFAIKFPQIKELINQQDMNWNKIKTQLLPENKKEIEDKAQFNKLVIKNFQRWNGLVNEFYNAIPKIDFSEATNEDKGECIKILKI